MDDKIIYSWYLNFVKFVDSTSSATIIVLIETFESLSRLRSQQEGKKASIDHSEYVEHHV